MTLAAPITVPVIRRTVVHTSMTTQRDTMTTRVRHQLSLDLGSSRDWPMFKRSIGSPLLPKLSASTVTWVAASADDRQMLPRLSRAGVAHRIARVARELNFTILVFIVTSTLQPNTRVVRHLRLWRSPTLVPAPELDARWPEVIAECGGRIRIATMGALGTHDIQWMLQLNESFDAAVPVLLPEQPPLGEPFLGELLHAAFPPNGCRLTPDFDWPLFSARIAELGGISIRRISEMSGDEISVDFFGADASAQRIAELVATDDEVTQARLG